MLRRGVLQDWPFWYHPIAPTGSAVRYLASLSSKFHRVSIISSQGKKLALGPSLNKKSIQSKLIQPIKNPQGKVKGRVEIQSRLMNAFTEAEKALVEKIATELGALWQR